MRGKIKIGTSVWDLHDLHLVDADTVEVRFKDYHLKVFLDYCMRGKKVFSNIWIKHGDAQIKLYDSQVVEIAQEFVPSGMVDLIRIRLRSRDIKVIK